MPRRRPAITSTPHPQPTGPDDPGERPHDPSARSGPGGSGQGRSGQGRPGPRSPLDAGFTHRGSDGGTGFAAGGVLDRMEACGKLAVAADRAWARGLDALSDDELAGLLCAQRRLASRAAAGELAVISELAARRAAPGGAPGEHLDDEVAVLLTLTGRAAAAQVTLAEDLGRLPAVSAALAAGRIDVAKARVFTSELIGVDDPLAAGAIAAALAVPAGEMTTGRLREEVRWQVVAFDPQAAAKRKEKAEKDARVECWTETSGTGAIAGRDLNLARTIAADQQVGADARWLRSRGAPGGLDRLRAEAFLARLSGQPLESLLPQLTSTPASPGGPAGTGAQGAVGPGTRNPCASVTSDGEAGTAGGPGGPVNPAGPDGLGGPVNPAGPDGLGGPVNPAAPDGLGGSVNLTIPLATWLDHADTPGQAAGYGTIDASTSRDLASILAAAGRARWCVTLTDGCGRAVAHGCARAGPGPPGTDRTAWLATVRIAHIETGTCAHRRESAAYQPSPLLRHIIKIRSPRCGFPGCRRPARRCDDDHTVPWHRGGRTCECNLHPLCRRHHRAKQAEGWHLVQPEPGVLTWTLPSGRRVGVPPRPYPA